MTGKELMKEMNVSEDEFEAALEALLANGLLEERIDEQGVSHFSVTELGRSFHAHMHSDRSTQN
jgi:predicted transcriptional regulator